jgi:hypothetical protein
VKGGSSVWAGCGGKKTGRTQGEQYPFLFIQNISKRLELIRSKGALPDFKKIQIKYDFEGFKIRNNFPYWKFSKFEIEFELKFKEAPRV